KSVLVSRIQNTQLDELMTFASNESVNLILDKYSRTAVLGIYQSEFHSKFKSAIVSAGTSDDYLVEEIGFVLNYFGFKYIKFADIGVAGIHRHKEALKEIEQDKSIKCIVVVAGQDGALFPVISAQTKLPIIAVPTSIGYGFGGRGLTALQSALQSCSPGVVVVNIDNGFGAASFVSKLLAQFELAN
ncbi:MAG: AIR carboxylase family protein, partial [Candidatus Kariarchaeaceae archaeon]